MIYDTFKKFYSNERLLPDEIADLLGATKDPKKIILDTVVENAHMIHSYNAYKELVAELGSAILCGMLGVSKQPMDNHAKYLNGWIKGLQDQPHLLLKACTMAQRSYSYLKDLQLNLF